MEQYLHSLDVLSSAVLLPDGTFVELQDPVFALHGLGPRYALVQNVDFHDRQLSYAMLDLPGTAYDLITDHDQPCELGTLEQLVCAAGGALHAAVDTAFRTDDRAGGFASKQQMALALIRAKADGITPVDQLGVLRAVRWAKRYELRAWWISQHRVEAFAAASIDWRALGIG